MEHLVFVPQVCPGRETIREYGPPFDDDLKTAAGALAAVFLGQRRDLCTQVAWMGRGCFSAAPGQRYLVAKGAGPSPGSERMRELLDAVMRARGRGQGGCLRLETESFFPLLVQFVARGGAWNISDPRPEGFSMFNFLCRDAEAAVVLRELGVRAVLPLVLLRNRIDPPWEAYSRSSLDGYLRARLPEAIERHVSSRDRLPIRFNSVVYLHMDGGVLIRHARSPYRVANLHQVVVDDDREGLELLTDHMRQVFGVHSASLGEVIDEFTVALARTAATMFAEGVIHGQLNVHHQNMTLAAEIADFDEVTFVRSRPERVGAVPFPGPRRDAVYDAFAENVKRLELRYGIDIRTVLDDDYDEFVGTAYEGVDEPRLGAFLLRQVYDFYSHAVIAGDMLARNDRATLSRPGPVNGAAGIRTMFVAAFIETVESHDARTLFEWCLANGREYLMQRLLAMRNRRTLYGWAESDAPLGDLISICDTARAEAIRRDAAGFIDELMNCAGIRTPAR